MRLRKCLDLVHHLRVVGATTQTRVVTRTRGAVDQGVHLLAMGHGEVERQVRVLTRHTANHARAVGRTRLVGQGHVQCTLRQRLVLGHRQQRVVLVTHHCRGFLLGQRVQLVPGCRVGIVRHHTQHTAAQVRRQRIRLGQEGIKTALRFCYHLRVIQIRQGIDQSTAQFLGLRRVIVLAVPAQLLQHW